MKTLFPGLAALAVIAAATPVSAQTVVVPAPAVPEVVVPAPAATVAVPVPTTDSSTRVKRVTVIPAPVAVPTGAPLAPVTTKTTTTTTTARTTINGVTVSDGVVDVYEPGARFVVRESTGPVSYSYGPQTVYTTPAGVALTAEQVRTRMRAGLPVRVEYLTEGQARVIQRVVIDDRYLKDD